MKKELEGPKVEGVGVAIIKEKGIDNIDVYNVYLINFKSETIEGVLVSSRGYGINKKTGEEIKTSELRHFLNVIEGSSFKKIEPIIKNVFKLNNEYWVSFFLNGQMYDKKFIFLPDSILENNFINIEIINKKGILIK